MVQNPQRIFGDIANQATQRDRETFDQWYLQTNCSIPHTFCRLQENKKK